MHSSWLIIDEENDYITVSSNEELVQVLDANLSKTEYQKFYVQSKLLCLIYLFVDNLSRFVRKFFFYLYREILPKI